MSSPHFVSLERAEAELGLAAMTRLLTEKKFTAHKTLGGSIRVNLPQLIELLDADLDDDL